MKRKVKRRGYLKERIVMAACAVTVLSALTAAGLWMREDDKGEDQGYVVDFLYFKLYKFMYFSCT